MKDLYGRFFVVESHGLGVMQVVYVIICFPVHKYKSRLSVLGNLDSLVRLYGNEFWVLYETFERVTCKYKLHSSFPVIHKDGNVGIFVKLLIEFNLK